MPANSRICTRCSSVNVFQCSVVSLVSARAASQMARESVEPSNTACRKGMHLRSEPMAISAF
jgi:hypothetical protein